MSVKDRLKELRQAARLSQADVHELTGISQSQISKFEKGMVLPSIFLVPSDLFQSHNVRHLRVPFLYSSNVGIALVFILILNTQKEIGRI